MAYSPELLKGTLKTIILKLLSDNRKMYGYEITQKVKELTRDEIQITEGSLYPTLHALESDKLVITQTEYIGKRIRKYYSLSAAGQNRNKRKTERFLPFYCYHDSVTGYKTKNKLDVPDHRGKY